MRIVSIVPSLTETICDLGLKDQLVGCTNFCVSPKNLHKSAQLIGGTKDPDIEAIRLLRPDKIIVNTEENKSEHIEELKQFCEVLETYPIEVRDVVEMLKELGDFLHVEQLAASFAEKIDQNIEQLNSAVAQQHAVQAWQASSYLYYIWRDPWMVAGRDTYIGKLLDLVGLVNLSPADARYPTVDWPEVKDLSPQIIFLSSEPWPFRKRDVEDLKREFGGDLPEILKIDGRDMSWYGTRTLSALRNLIAWISGKKQDLIRPFN